MKIKEQPFDLVKIALLGIYFALLSIIPVLLIHLFPLLYMKRFVRVMFPEHFPEHSSPEKLEYLFKKYKISKREREIVRLICLGKSNTEIKGELYISMPTVKEHISNIYRKTGVKNRVQLSNLFHFFKV